MRATRPLLLGHGFPGNRPSTHLDPTPALQWTRLLQSFSINRPCISTVALARSRFVDLPPLGRYPVRVWHAFPSLTVTWRLDYLLLSSTFFLPSLSPSELPSYTYLSSNNIVISLANRLPRAKIYGCYGITALILKRIGIGRALVPI
jgi:hypothetical protein